MIHIMPKVLGKMWWRLEMLFLMQSWGFRFVLHSLGRSFILVSPGHINTLIILLSFLCSLPSTSERSMVYFFSFSLCECFCLCQHGVIRFSPSVILCIALGESYYLFGNACFIGFISVQKFWVKMLEFSVLLHVWTLNPQTSHTSILRI